MIDFFRLMRRIFLVSILFMVVASGCYDRHSYGPIDEFTAKANCTAQELYELSGEACYTITSDMVLVGYVTSTDVDSNFYHTLIVNDRTRAVELLIDNNLLFSQYPLGALLAINLNGLATMIENGILQVGLPPRSFDSKPRHLDSPELLRKHKIRSNSREEVSPRNCKAENLDLSLCGELITIDNLQYSPLDGLETENTMAGYHRFTEGENGTIFTFVRDYAYFADMEIPQTTLSVTGILYYEPVGMNIGRQFVIRPRTADDITIIDASR